MTGRSSDVVVGNVVQLSGSGAFASRHARTDKTVNVSAVAVAGPDAANYSLVSTTVSSTGSIPPLALSPSFEVSTKVYDGDVSATASGCGVMAGDVLSLSGAAVFRPATRCTTSTRKRQSLAA